MTAGTLFMYLCDLFFMNLRLQLTGKEPELPDLLRVLCFAVDRADISHDISCKMPVFFFNAGALNHS